MNYREKVRKSFKQQKIMGLIGAKLTGVKKGFCEIQLPYKTVLTQQDGFVHAGIIGTIADSAGGCAAYTMMEEGASVLTIEYKLNLLAPAAGDMFIARSRAVKAGKAITVCNSEVVARTGKKEKLCATATVTLIALKK
ncbi:MAG: PaaI family thioesterase [Deltaproteobacteria bacterium]|nr:PaaI family thioesterase [Deltaproteobacteria bacterium]